MPPWKPRTCPDSAHLQSEGRNHASGEVPSLEFATWICSLSTSGRRHDIFVRLYKILLHSCGVRSSLSLSTYEYLIGSFG